MIETARSELLSYSYNGYNVTLGYAPDNQVTKEFVQNLGEILRGDDNNNETYPWDPNPVAQS
jgi:hypothetical protein